MPPNQVYNYFCAALGEFPNNQESEVFISHIKYSSYIFLALINYFVATYLGPSKIHQNFALMQGNAEAVNNFVRQEIIRQGWQNRNAIFDIPTWNVVDRTREGLSRTNNSLEGFYRVFNGYLQPNPRLSSFMKKIFKEQQRWMIVIEDYEEHPGDGIRGGLTRRKRWLRQDRDLIAMIKNFNNTPPLEFLRRIARKISSKISV